MWFFFVQCSAVQCTARRGACLKMNAEFCDMLPYRNRHVILDVIFTLACDGPFFFYGGYAPKPPVACGGPFFFYGGYAPKPASLQLK